jgi:hypothetical protein
MEVAAGELVGEFGLRFELRDTEEMLPVDALACDFRVVDNEGRSWGTTSRFTTRVFLTHMFDFSAPWHMNLFRPEEADKEYTRAFVDLPFLQDARFSSDDRFYRILLVGRRQISISFHYTCVRFDVAGVLDHEGKYLDKLAVKVRAGSFWDWESPGEEEDEEDEEDEDVGELGYYMEVVHLLRNNTGAFDAERGFWVDNPMPAPLVFVPGRRKGVPQQNVRVVSTRGG